MRQFFRYLIIPCALLVCALPGSAAIAAATSEPGSSTWDLSDLYPSPQAWSESFARTKAAAEKLDDYRGSLGSSADALFKALDAISTVNKESDRLSVYANLKG